MSHKIEMDTSKSSMFNSLMFWGQNVGTWRLWS